jgi:hypothetical protein
MKTAVAKFVAGGFLLFVLLFGASRFLSYHSLTVDVLGSYFPAWMVCILSGLTLTLIAHWIVEFRNLKPYLGPAPLIYSCLMIVFTFATRILFYQN